MRMPGGLTDEEKRDFASKYHNEKMTWCLAIEILFNWQNETIPWRRRRTSEFLAPRCAIILSVSALILHFWWAWSSACGLNFARAGADVVLIAATAYAWVEWHSVSGGLLSGGPVNRFAIWESGWLLPALAAGGTLIWGYGDLLPFGKC
ncbi:hypothetical protein [Labrys neptuniae]